MVDPLWQELDHKASGSDADAWGRVMDLWPEATGGEADPRFSMVYGMVMERLAAEWMALNHPDPKVRRKILRLAKEIDPYFKSRGHPMRRSAAEVSVKDWRPSARILRERVENTVDRILAFFFEGLRTDYPGSTHEPVAPEIIRRFRPCVMSFFMNWLGYNYPDSLEVERLADAYELEDPYFFDRCGAGGEAGMV